MENILNLYSQVKGKTKFLQAAADELGVSPLTIRNNWIGGFKIIPKHQQEPFTKLLQNQIKNQNSK